MIEKLGITDTPWDIGDKERGENPLMVYCDDTTGQRIADCTNNLTWHTPEDKKRNALLIATAPDILEALLDDLKADTKFMDEDDIQFIMDNCQNSTERFHIRVIRNIKLLEKVTDRVWSNKEIKELLEEK